MLVEHDDGEAVARPHARTATRRPLPARPAQGSYKLPADAQERLRTALISARNREAAETLAVFLARFWSSATRLCLAFPIDRRALSDHRLLGLTEAEIRGAIRTLERVGFLDRDLVPRGSRYRATSDGLRRKPALFRFGQEYGLLFTAANRRAARGRSVPSPGTTASTGATIPVRGLTRPVEAGPWSPKDKGRLETELLMGDRVQRSAEAVEPFSALERALQSWGRAIEVEQTGTT